MSNSDRQKLDDLVVKGYNDGKNGVERSTSDVSTGERILTGALLGGPVGAVIAVFVPSPSRETSAQNAYDRGYSKGQQDHDREVINNAKKSSTSS